MCWPCGVCPNYKLQGARSRSGQRKVNRSQPSEAKNAQYARSQRSVFRDVIRQYRYKRSRGTCAHVHSGVVFSADCRRITPNPGGNLRDLPDVISITISRPLGSHTSRIHPACVSLERFHLFPMLIPGSSHLPLSIHFCLLDVHSPHS
jgi:hypothetical protein